MDLDNYDEAFNFMVDKNKIEQINKNLFKKSIYIIMENKLYIVVQNQ